MANENVKRSGKLSAVPEPKALADAIRSKFTEIGNMLSGYVFSAASPPATLKTAVQQDGVRAERTNRRPDRQSRKLHYDKTDVQGLVRDTTGKYWFLYHYYNQMDALPFCADASSRRRADGVESEKPEEADHQLGRAVDPRDHQLYLLIIPFGQSVPVKVPTDKLPSTLEHIWLGTPPVPREP